MATTKIERKLFATYIKHQGSTPAYVLLGTDLEELNVEMNANVVKTANILGQVSTSIDKYEKQMSVEPFKADSGNALFTWLKDIVDGDKVLSDLETTICHVDLYATPTGSAYPAYEEAAIVEIVSYGGNTEGFQIPFNVHLTGVRTKGTFNPTTATFTAEV